MMNCSGGPMPWGAWVTCEETINGPDVFDDFTRGALPPTTYIKNAQLTRPHGYVFEVPVEGAASAQPVRKAGRFAHEAIAVDPAEGAAYLTEDDFGFPSGFYKYVPPTNPVEAGKLVDGGQLFMLAVKGWPNAPLADSQQLRATFQTVWVPVDDPDPDFPRLPDGTPTTTNDDAIHYVAGQGWDQGAAYFSRLEGAVYDNGVVYFCSTQGGGEPEDPDISTTRPSGYGKGSGQIWAYNCRSGRLQLLYQAPDRDTLDFPDNITASPRGTLVICEDNVEDNYLRGLSRGGQLWDLALNRLPNRTNDEFAGSTFSPDGSTLYVNIQASNGMSFAIWGPWERVGV
jgi:secreted PhoX family phosphatase